MNNVCFLLNFALLQKNSKRSTVSVSAIMKQSTMPRSTVHRYLNKFIEMQLIARVGYGKYVLTDNEALQAIGYVTVTPLEFFSWNTEKMREEKTR